MGAASSAAGPPESPAFTPTRRPSHPVSSPPSSTAARASYAELEGRDDERVAAAIEVGRFPGRGLSR